MKKLYKVKIATYAIIAAESELAACREARFEIEDIVLNDQSAVQCCGRFLDGDAFPGRWNTECLPYGCDEDKTIAEYLKP